MVEGSLMWTYKYAPLERPVKKNGVITRRIKSQSNATASSDWFALR